MPHECHFAYVVAGRCLYCNDVAYLELEVGCVAVVSLARIFETYLYKVVFGLRFGEVFEPIIDFEFSLFATKIPGIKFAFFYIIVDGIVHDEYRLS